MVFRLFTTVLCATFFISGCATGTTDDGNTIGAWDEPSCTGELASHYASLLPGFVRDFNIAVSPTARYESTSDTDIIEAVSQSKTIADYLYIPIRASFTDPYANIFDYRRAVDFASRASMGISLAIDIRSLPSGARFSDHSIRQGYLDEVETLIFEHKPDYLNLCVEMNAYALDDTTHDDYPYLVTLYEEAYNLAKSMSPSTVVYVSHSWELDLLNAADAPLQLLADIEFKLDAAGISTFPQLAGVEQPSDIPGIYYADLPLYVDVPIIVECGFSDSSDYNSSEIIARDFPAELMRALEDLNLMQVQLVEMHDIISSDLDPFFQRMGLRREDGAAKQIYCGWKYIEDSGN